MAEAVPRKKKVIDRGRAVWAKVQSRAEETTKPFSRIKRPK